MSIVWGVSALLLENLTANLLAGLFISDAAIVPTAITAIRVMAFCIPFKGGPNITSAVLQAKKKPLHSIALQLGGTFLIKLPLLLALSNLFFQKGIWIAQPVGDAALFAVSIVLLCLESRKGANRYGK